MIVGVTAEQIRSWPVHPLGWHISPDTPDWIMIGDGAKIGDGVKIGGQEHILHAHILQFIANAYRLANGSLVLRYGCETHPFAEWTPEAIAVMCRRHKPNQEAEYAAALTALVALVRSI